MKIQDSYFVALSNGTYAWLAAGKPAPADAFITEVRPILIPDDGMILRHKETGEESSGHWLRGDDNKDKWEEVQATTEA